MTRTKGVVLAGGRARRMGTDKAGVRFRGLPMLDHVTAALQAADLEVLVVGGAAPPGWAHVPDLDGFGGGPAVGLLTAFEHLPGVDVFLVAVDQPMLRPATIQALLDLDGAAVVPVDEGHPQVTCGLYRHECLRPLRQLLEEGGSKLRRLLTDVGANLVDDTVWATWGEDGRSWMSLDTPRAVADAEALL